jgi:4-azaleucine resistance transporter AzlC
VSATPVAAPTLARPRADRARTAIRRDAVAIGVACGAYGVSFGAVATAGGLSVWQTMVLSLLMFTGASQFAFIGALSAGGAPFAAAFTAILLGARNAFYGLRLADLLGLKGWRRAAAAQIVIDESTAMAIVRDDRALGRFAFLATGLSVFVLWNLGTFVGAFGAESLSDPEVLGLDAAAPAAFVALLAPALRGREPWAVAACAAAFAVALTPFVPAGIPVLGAAGIAIAAALRPR